MDLVPRTDCRPTSSNGSSADNEATHEIAVGQRVELRGWCACLCEDRRRDVFENSQPKMRGVTPPAAGPPALWSVAGLRSLDALSVGHSEVLYAFLCLDGEPSARDEAVLDDEERARSRRFLQPGDRQRFVVSHVSMRVLLARCLDVRPEAIRYDANGDGKPRLAPELGPLEFSLSHSGAVGLLAVTPDRPVGVDVEHLRDMADALLIAQQHFARSEIEALRSVAPDARPAAFLLYWTNKEAVIKATGEGLGRPLDSFELDMTDPMAALKRFDSSPGDRCGWSLRELRSPTGFVAAGAVASAPGAPPQRWRALRPVASADQGFTRANRSGIYEGSQLPRG